MMLDLQNLLVGICKATNKENYRCVINSTYFNDLSLHQALIRNIIFLNRVRTMKLVDLVSNLVLKSQDFKSELIKFCLNQNSNSILTKLPDLHLIRSLITNHNIEYNETIHIIIDFIENSKSEKLYRYIIFALFVDMIESINEEFFNAIMSQIMQETLATDHFLGNASNDPQTLFNLWVKSIYTCRTKEQRSEFTLNLFNHFGHDNEVYDALRTDNLEQLQNIIANESDFYYDEIVDSSLFEPSEFLKNEPSLIQYAAYYGSCQCFKYLLMNGADVEYIDQDNKLVVDYAIASGELEIIHICQHKSLDFKYSLGTSAYFWRKDIYSWLIENNLAMITSVDRNQKNVAYLSAISNCLLILSECFEDCKFMDDTDELLGALKGAGSIDALKYICDILKIDPNSVFTN